MLCNTFSDDCTQIDICIISFEKQGQCLQRLLFWICNKVSSIKLIIKCRPSGLRSARMLVSRLNSALEGVDQICSRVMEPFRHQLKIVSAMRFCGFLLSELKKLIYGFTWALLGWLGLVLCTHNQHTSCLNHLARTSRRFGEGFHKLT